MTDPWEARLHAYLDGELPPAEAHRLEERLAGDPEARAALAALQALDRSLRAALEPLAARPVPRLGRPVRRRRSSPLLLRAAVYGCLFALGGVAGWLVSREAAPLPPPAGSGPTRPPAAARPGGGPRSWPAVPALPGTTPPRAVSPAPGGARTPSPQTMGKPQLFAALEAFLAEAARTGRWNAERAQEVLHALGQRSDLNGDDFRRLQALFFQQPPHTMGQLYVAQSISRYFLHLPEARRFIYDQIRTELARFARDPGYLGDRALRRAWTEGLVHTYDGQSVALLEQLGRLERDWLNRRNVYGGLAAVGTPEAALALARLAAREPNPVLRYEGLLYLRDLVYVDPTVAAPIRPQLEALLKRVVLGPFGKNGSYWDAMVWALQILDLLGVPTQNLRRQWLQRNRTEQGGDVRGGTPGGIPVGENR